MASSCLGHPSLHGAHKESFKQGSKISDGWSTRGREVLLSGQHPLYGIQSKSLLEKGLVAVYMVSGAIV